MPVAGIPDQSGLDLAGRGVGAIRLFVRILSTKFKDSKKCFGFWPNNDLNLHGYFAAEGRFIQCKFGKTDREGAPVARGGLALARGGATCS